MAPLRLTDPHGGLSRRALLCAGGVALAAAVGSCAEPLPSGSVPVGAERRQRGRLTFRPPARPARPARPAPDLTGRQPRAGLYTWTDTDGPGSAQVHAPADAGDGDMRLVLMLHGAGGRAGSALGILRNEVAGRRVILAAPQSTGRTWDVLTGGFGPDVRLVDRLLKHLAASYPLRGFTIGGFSDGASYALTLGLTNGDVFDSVIAFSPGFNAAPSHAGEPRFFISHGTEDRVLPIKRCSRRIVPALKESGYNVTYREFPGGHIIPRLMQEDAVEWLLEPSTR